MDGGDGCFGWEAGVLQEMGMEAGHKDSVAAAVRRVRAAFAQPAITSPWYPWPLGGWAAQANARPAPPWARLRQLLSPGKARHSVSHKFW